MNYYGVDWLLFLLILVHLWLLGNQMRVAFLVGIAATIIGVFFGYLINSFATISMNIVFSMMHLRAYLMWKQLNVHIADLIPLVDEPPTEEDCWWGSPRGD